MGLPAAIIGGSIISGLFSSKAASTQAHSADQAAAEQRREFDLAASYGAPYRTAGYNALSAISSAMGLPTNGLVPGAAGGTTQPGAPDYGGFYASPDYQFRRDEGMRGIEQSAAARGGAFSGNALKGITDFNSNLAANEFGSYLNRLFTTAGLGSQSATNTGQQAIQTGALVGNSLMQAGDARASGYAGLGNAVTNGLGQYLYYNSLAPQATPGVSGAVPGSPSAYGPYAGGYQFPGYVPPDYLAPYGVGGH